MRITGVRTVTCDIPLPRPIVMGQLRFDSREYVLVIVETDAGIRGIGFGMTRDAPVATIVERNLAPLLIGRDPAMVEQLWHLQYDRNLTIGGQGIFMRALSAVDIALWDIKGQVAGQPVWTLLGGARERVPVSVAGGYPRAGAAEADLAREVDDYATRGFGSIKISAGDLASDTARLRAASEAAAGRATLSYDAHWAWRDLLDVLPTVRAWADLDLAFIEDPFAPELWPLAAELRRRVPIPLALGEDAVGRWAFERLFSNFLPDLVRVDATTVGGLSEAVKVCAMASARGRSVLPHVFPEVHIHLAAALPAVRAVEVTLPEYEIEALHLLFRDWLTFERGEAVAPSLPGLGFLLDERAVTRYSVHTTLTKADQ
ncbi:MAG TPA: mandelate racemase/muconate lactonizing enzyme family protein [Candidatus Saccharimonadales bacterium]|nr:mandelate racemase/muconate lactonizing enzyme family protein [Candidatus Saccharimonadales bacterium]